MNRRTFLHAGAGTFLGALLSRYAFADGPAATSAAKAKSVILLWMNGGPSHIDTWDPKPGAPTGGPFKAIKTAQPALSLSEHMPRIATVANKLTVLRMSSKEGNHQRAQYLMHTGYAPNPTVEHPSMGAWMSKKLGAPTRRPPRLREPRRAELRRGVPGRAERSLRRADARRDAGQRDQPRSTPSVGPGGRRSSPRPTTASRRRSAAAWRPIAARSSRRPSGSWARPICRPSTSRPSRRRSGRRYGDTPFGKGCLVARRLVERGVRFVEVVLDGWDTHQNNFERVKAQLGILDPAMSALVKDLDGEEAARRRRWSSGWATSDARPRSTPRTGATTGQARGAR